MSNLAVPEAVKEFSSSSERLPTYYFIPITFSDTWSADEYIRLNLLRQASMRCNPSTLHDIYWVPFPVVTQLRNVMCQQNSLTSYRCVAQLSQMTSSRLIQGLETNSGVQ